MKKRSSGRQAKSLDPELARTYTGRIRDIKQETLIMWGRNDIWIPLKDGCRFNQEIKRSALIVIPQCGHVPQEEKPDEFARILYHFLSDTPERTAWQCRRRLIHVRMAGMYAAPISAAGPGA